MFYCMFYFTCDRSLSTHVLRIFVETKLHELFEMFAEAATQLRWQVLGYEKERPHWMKVRVRRLTLRQFYCCNAQTPDVHLSHFNITYTALPS